MTVKVATMELEQLIMKAVQKALHAAHHEFVDSGWLSLKEGAKYAGVSYNTLMKYRTLGLQVCEIDGVKRISRKEIDRFFQEHSF
ncbi:helix-turn-helix domain-containing protein [Solibacillus cecembensis]|uniref:helix-turn-helix domain-containing protein n=1 Tax=Solibacillus cecembensis TaxID=459347 RepID=UPI003CFF6A55